MKADDFGLWNVYTFEGCEIQCPECKEWASHNNWTETEVYCEDCGEHSAIRCPNCDEVFDHVWSPMFEVREPV